MILLIGGEKGGTGKTTVATNLAALRAAAGVDVLLVDTDRQGTAAAWCQLRHRTPGTPAGHLRATLWENGANGDPGSRPPLPRGDH